MGLAQPISETKLLYTVEEYLEFERQAETRHEYLDGELYEMAGESLAHSQINVNISRIISTQLLGKSRQVLSPNMKVRSGPHIKQQKTTKGLFSYPDLSVVCGTPQFHDKYKDVLLNPMVIIEILSESTKNLDRRIKFLRYRTWIETLTDYILILQTEPTIEHYQPQPDGKWLLTTITGLERSLYIESIDCTLHLSEVYDRVIFPAEETESETSEGELSTN
jgi:Uma2 family endonuclease